MTEKIKDYRLGYEELMKMIPCAIYVILDGKITDCNKVALEMFNYKNKKEVIGYKPHEISPKKQDDGQLSFAKSQILMKKVLKEKKPTSFQWTHKRKNGDCFKTNIELFVKGKFLYAVIIDIHEKEQINIKMNELEEKDFLTGLYNRNFFLRYLNQTIKENNLEFSVIVIDIEGFKEINDSLGHIMADKLLIELARRLKTFTNNECLVSRFESDEFAIICKKTSKKYLDKAAEKLLKKIKSPYKIENTIIYLDFNIGISRYPYDGKDAQTLVRASNIAIYKVRNQISKKICYYSKEMSEEIEEKFHLANYLASGISNNEFYMNYQPIYNIENNDLVGFEALIRWENPVLGKVPPDTFIPIAEDTGHILSIGELVLKEVCKQIKCWESSDLIILPVAINVSVKQLELIDFSKMVKEILDKYHIDYSLIDIEITESVSSGNLPIILKNINKLKKMGIKISMDDFGTGFSSLAQLGLMELDKLKIDKVFIEDIVNVKKRQNLVKAIIVMAKSLDLTVIAEGIETNDQLEILKSLGCEMGQGYLYSKPLSPIEIEKFYDFQKYKEA